MRNASTETRIFWLSLNYFFWHIVIIFLSKEIQDKLLLADVLDILTPFFMIFMGAWLWLALDESPVQSKARYSRLGALFLFTAGAVAFVEGHGMHLSANAVARHLTQIPETSVYRLTYFFDEILGHILWDSGWVLMCVGIAWRAVGLAPQQTGSRRMVYVAAFFFGFTYSCNAIEGQTVIFMLPAALISATTLIVMRWRATKKQNPVLAFFMYGCLVACFLFAFWYFLQGSFVEFSKAGWV